MGVGQIWWQRF